MTLVRLHFEEVTLGTNRGLERHHDALTDGVDWRVRNLSEKLAKVVVDHPRLSGHAREGGIVNHGGMSGCAEFRWDWGRDLIPHFEVHPAAAGLLIQLHVRGDRRERFHRDTVLI